MKFSYVALLASTANAFTPSIPTKNGFTIKTPNQRLRLLPDPSFGEITNIATQSAFSSSSLTTSNFIDGLVSNVGGLVLIAGVGAGVYSTALQEKHSELQDKLNNAFQKDTGSDFAVAVVEEPVKVVEVAVEEAKEAVAEEIVEEIEAVEEAIEEIVEEIDDISGEVLATTPAPAPPTSEKLLQETEKAIAEVKAKGVEETKAKISFNDSLDMGAKIFPPLEDEEPEKEVEKKDPGAKRQIAQGVTLIVAAVGVALARNVIKAWLGRGMF